MNTSFTDVSPFLVSLSLLSHWCCILGLSFKFSTYPAFLLSFYFGGNKLRQALLRNDISSPDLYPQVIYLSL